MTARHHHFLSQFYLKGFVGEQSKQLVVIDIKRNISFETNPRNVGGVRDFNRIEREGFDPNYLEKGLSRFEGRVATALNNLRETLDFSGETKGLILNFITLIACRSPEMRKCMKQVEALFVESVMSTALSSKEMWESLIHNLKNNNKLEENACRSPEMRECMKQIEVLFIESVMNTAIGSKEMRESQIHNLKKNNKLKENISCEDASYEDASYEDASYEDASYEDVKNIFEAKKYTIEVSREHRILTELSLMDTILPLLLHRQWLLLIADKKSGPFVTTDSPVTFFWKDPEKIPPFCRDSSAFGLKETRVYFPISQELALIGDFDGNDTNVNATEELVAKFNSVILCKRYTQVYAPKFDFKF